MPIFVTDLARYPDWTTTALEETRNCRPRKVLGFKAPHEIFYREKLTMMGKPLRLGLEFGASS
ncbi:hypothetical protein AKJ09_04096 [Labilithrix luteola]|uniref:Uncharacterized protein n=1 Tax=Labilithrix luteola TaxID=1391654 RepID=A0A0K1PV75_9BACT|nr:hypothetical protein AKJ09_04096 [Labilithrix luteola]